MHCVPAALRCRGSLFRHRALYCSSFSLPARCKQLSPLLSSTPPRKRLRRRSRRSRRQRSGRRLRKSTSRTKCVADGRRLLTPFASFFALYHHSHPHTHRHPSLSKTSLVEETNAKFEREMILHARDIETLQKVKAELEQVKASVRAAEDGAAAARSELEVSKSSWEAQKRTLEQDVTKLESRWVPSAAEKAMTGVPDVDGKHWRASRPHRLLLPAPFPGRATLTSRTSFCTPSWMRLPANSWRSRRRSCLRCPRCEAVARAPPCALLESPPHLRLLPRAPMAQPPRLAPAARSSGRLSNITADRRRYACCAHRVRCPCVSRAPQPHPPCVLSRLRAPSASRQSWRSAGWSSVLSTWDGS